MERLWNAVGTCKRYWEKLKWIPLDTFESHFISKCRKAKATMRENLCYPFIQRAKLDNVKNIISLIRCDTHVTNFYPSFAWYTSKVNVIFCIVGWARYIEIKEAWLLCTLKQWRRNSSHMNVMIISIKPLNIQFKESYKQISMQEMKIPSGFKTQDKQHSHPPKVQNSDIRALPTNYFKKVPKCSQIHHNRRTRTYEIAYAVWYK